MFCSSEKINGNKTSHETQLKALSFCSSEKINGNKTRHTITDDLDTVLF